MVSRTAVNTHAHTQNKTKQQTPQNKQKQTNQKTSKPNPTWDM